MGVGCGMRVIDAAASGPNQDRSDSGLSWDRNKVTSTKGDREQAVAVGCDEIGFCVHEDACASAKAV